MGWVLSRNSIKADVGPEVLFNPSVSSHNKETVQGSLLPMPSLRVTEHPATARRCGTQCSVIRSPCPKELIHSLGGLQHMGFPSETRAHKSLGAGGCDERVGKGWAVCRVAGTLEEASLKLCRLLLPVKTQILTKASLFGGFSRRKFRVKIAQKGLNPASYRVVTAWLIHEKGEQAYQ